MTCVSKKLLFYVISCVIQYIRETLQALRSRMSNHRQRLNQMCDFFCVNAQRKENALLSFQTTAITVKTKERWKQRWKFHTKISVFISSHIAPGF